ncbi:MAG: hypothetical protein ACKV19_13410 [Verrucomicrobiales bacterium]
MKKFLLGCGVVVAVALVAAVIAAVVWGPRLVDWGGEVVHQMKEGIGREQQRLDAVQNWAGPGPAVVADALFPARVGAAVRTAVREEATLGALGVARAARQATYTQAGGEIEVWAYAVNDLERDGLLAQIRTAYDASSGTKSTVTVPSRASFSGTALGTSHVLTPPGWFLVFRPRGEGDALPFIDDFFGLPSGEGKVSSK